MKRRTTTAGIIEREGALLLLRKRKDSSIGDVWEFPGGKSREGESPEEALIRECFEETGLEVIPGKQLGEFSFTNKETRYTLLVFAILEQRGMVAITSDHIDYRWVPREELLSYDMSPSDRKISQEIILNSR